MDDFLNDFTRLAQLARQATKAPPIAPDLVMRRLDGLIPGPESEEVISFSFFMGLGTLAAVAAIAVGFIAAPAWAEISSPLRILASLPSLTSLLSL
ncbi:MAG: hypothetical protein LBU79_07315 [Planctomycetota bacterium]|jgi:hypothetical protein|nr:hypothetical protein [Planctomycetota bacterium]